MGRILGTIGGGVMALLGALWTWHAVTAAVTVVGASDWLVPAVAATVCATGLLTVAICAPTILWGAAVSCVVALSALIVVPGWVTAVVALLAGLMLARGVMAVRTDMTHALRFRPRQHARAGAPRVVLALSMLVAAVIYAAVTAHDAASLMFGDGMRAALRSPMAAMVMPQLRATDGTRETATVDDFLRAMIASQLGQDVDDTALSVQFMEDYAGSVTQGLRGMLPQTAAPAATTLATDAAAAIPPQLVAEARAALSRQVGRTLTGREPVADVFATLLERSMQSYAEERLLPQGYRYSTAIAGLIAGFLFIMVWSVGALLRPLWSLAAAGIVMVLRMTGLLTVTVRMVEKEELA